MDARDMVIEAGRLLKARFQETPRFREKARFELVAEADHEVEQMLVAKLRGAFPGDSICSEEAGAINRDGRARWIVDPIDGTANFIAGIPYFAISLARESNGDVVEAYVYNPVSEELYWSTGSTGKSYLNETLISVSTCADIAQSLVAFGFSAHMANIQRYYTEWQPLFDGCKKGLPVIVPSLTLCNVARGRLDAFIDFGCSMEGQAAGALILLHAGGAVLNYDLTDYDHRTRGVVAAAPGILGPLRSFRRTRPDS